MYCWCYQYILVVGFHDWLWFDYYHYWYCYCYNYYFNDDYYYNNNYYCYYYDHHHYYYYYHYTSLYQYHWNQIAVSIHIIIYTILHIGSINILIWWLSDFFIDVHLIRSLCVYILTTIILFIKWLFVLSYFTIILQFYFY